MENNVREMSSETRIFKRGDKTLTVRFFNGNGWDFTTYPRDILIMSSLIDCYLDEFNPHFIFNGELNILKSLKSFPWILDSKNTESRIIYLNVDNNYWSQQVYQLSHELTHFFIKGNSKEANNWFYESLCELASWYFLKKIQQYIHEKCPINEIKDWTPHFDTYLNNMLIEVDDIKNPEEWLKLNEAELVANDTNRILNAQCAKLLLPLFEKNRGAWNILFFAPHRRMSLIHLFEEWKNNLPQEAECPCILDQIQSILSGKKIVH